MLEVTFCPSVAVNRTSQLQLSDMLDYYSPDVVITELPAHRPQLQRVASSNIEVVGMGGRAFNLSELATQNCVSLIRVPNADALASLPEFERTHQEVLKGHSYLLSNLLQTTVDLTKLDTRLEGKDAYETALEETGLDGTYTHLTTQAGPDYRATWDDLTVQGTMPAIDSQQGQSEPKFAHLTLQNDGVVTAKTRRPGHFGLQALSQVGATRAETLRDAGYQSREAVADAEITDLTALSGFGRTTAQTVTDAAEAFIDGEVRQKEAGSLPSSEPIFIDIETDGLTPTMVWLIGVLDRNGDESYISFIAKDPDRPGEAVEAFMMWLDANAQNRPVVAYNGEKFDFPVLHEHIADHCPEYVDTWERTQTFDPLFWATTKNNAALPGRTNELEDVAARLGWDSDETGLSGATVGRLFQRYMRNPCAETALDWERHKRYCEDDVRSLAFVHDAIADASRLDAGGGSSNRSGSSNGDASAEGTAQGQLTDF